MHKRVFQSLSNVAHQAAALRPNIRQRFSSFGQLTHEETLPSAGFAPVRQLQPIRIAPIIQPLTFHTPSPIFPAPPPVSLLSQALAAHLKKNTQRLEEEKRRLLIRERYVVGMDTQRDFNNNVGDQRLAMLRWRLNNLGIIPSQDQATFFEAFIQACCPHIYGLP